MKNRKLNLTIVFLFGIALNGMLAQETLSASGGNASGSGGSTSYSVGQVAYSSNTGSNGSVTQGVQQAFEISVVSGIEQAKDISLKLSAYPNPTTNFIILKIEGSSLQLQSIASLYNVDGKLLFKKNINSAETTISMENILPGTYFLKLTQTLANAPQEIKTFKIIKN